MRCPKCNGARGKVIGHVTVKKVDRGGKLTYTYDRFTHRMRVERKDYEAAKLRYEESGVKRRPPVPWSLKRKYCYQRVG